MNTSTGDDTPEHRQAADEGAVQREAESGRIRPIELAPTLVADEPVVLWISQDGRISSDAPSHARGVPLAQAQEWIDGQVPRELLEARLSGVLVLWDDAQVRRVARTLRDRLAPRTARGLTELAATSPYHELELALRSFDSADLVTPATLARALTAQATPSALHTARLLRALESL